MSAPAEQQALIEHWEARLIELLQTRNNLHEDDLGYLVEKVSVLRDERLKACIGALIGWGDDERADMETFCAIALETMKIAKPSLIREASRRVELKYHLKHISQADHKETP